jgi:hypothetical protein
VVGEPTISTQVPGERRTHSGRISRPPAYLKDFVP